MHKILQIQILQKTVLHGGQHSIKHAIFFCFYFLTGTRLNLDYTSTKPLNRILRTQDYTHFTLICFVHMEDIPKVSQGKITCFVNNTDEAEVFYYSLTSLLFLIHSVTKTCPVDSPFVSSLIPHHCFSFSWLPPQPNYSVNKSLNSWVMIPMSLASLNLFLLWWTLYCQIGNIIFTGLSNPKSFKTFQPYIQRQLVNRKATIT